MGNKESKIRDPLCPFTVLELDPNSTVDEIKRQYHRLLLKYHPDRNKNVSPEKILEIKAAYEKVKDGKYKIVIAPPDLSKYTKQYFSLFAGDLFYKEVNRIYNTINKYENNRHKDIKWPQFGNANTKMTPNSLFYVFYKSYKHEGLFNDEVKQLTNIVQSVDPRLRKTVHDCVIKTQTIVKEKTKKARYKKSADKYKFYCDACQKGFMSDKTMENHIKSEKHKIKKLEQGLEDINIDELREQAKFVDMAKEIENDNTEDENMESDTKNNEHIQSGTQTGEIKHDNTEDENMEFDTKTNEHIQFDTQTGEIQNDNFATKTNVYKLEKTSNNVRKQTKIKKKKKRYEHYESLDALTCSVCKCTFESRNKLFNHIRTEHLKK